MAVNLECQGIGNAAQDDRIWRLFLTAEAQSTQRSAEILRAAPCSLCLCGEKCVGINVFEPNVPIEVRLP